MYSLLRSPCFKSWYQQSAGWCRRLLGRVPNCSEVPDIVPMACDRHLATTGRGVGWCVPTCGLPHTVSKSGLNTERAAGRPDFFFNFD